MERLRPAVKIVDVAAGRQDRFMTPAQFAFADNTWAPVLQRRSISRRPDSSFHDKNTSAATVTWRWIIVARTTTNFFKTFTASSTPAVQSPRLSIAGSSCAACARCRGRMRAHSENALKVANFLTKHRRLSTCTIRDCGAFGTQHRQAPDVDVWWAMLSSSRRRPRGSDECRRGKQRSLFGATSLGGVESLNRTSCID